MEVSVKVETNRKTWKKWTDEDLELMLLLRREGCKYEEIAINMDRTLDSIKKKFAEIYANGTIEYFLKKFKIDY